VDPDRGDQIRLRRVLIKGTELNLLLPYSLIDSFEQT